MYGALPTGHRQNAGAVRKLCWKVAYDALELSCLVLSLPCCAREIQIIEDPYSGRLHLCPVVFFFFFFLWYWGLNSGLKR
jgi:hypothetical protein